MTQSTQGRLAVSKIQAHLPYLNGYLSEHALAKIARFPKHASPTKAYNHHQVSLYYDGHVPDAQNPKAHLIRSV